MQHVLMFLYCHWDIYSCIATVYILGVSLLLNIFKYQEIVLEVFTLRIFLFGNFSDLSFAMNFQIVNVEAVELLQRMVPNEEEVKAYQQFNTSRKDVNELTEEDKV